MDTIEHAIDQVAEAQATMRSAGKKPITFQKGALHRAPKLVSRARRGPGPFHSSAWHAGESIDGAVDKVLEDLPDPEAAGELGARRDNANAKLGDYATAANLLTFCRESLERIEGLIQPGGPYYLTRIEFIEVLISELAEDVEAKEKE